MPCYKWIESPIAELLLAGAGDALTGLYIKGQKHFPEVAADWQRSPDLELFTQVETQLAEYFANKRQSFDLPLAPQGTDFQQQVWQHLHQIPFGQTTSYGAIARALGKPGASQAVGAANGRNPISIIVPCHRVIGASGKMTGYAGGIDRKQWLLRHERTEDKGNFPSEKSCQNAKAFQPSLALFESGAKAYPKMPQNGR